MFLTNPAHLTSLCVMFCIYKTLRNTSMPPIIFFNLPFPGRHYHFSTWRCIDSILVNQILHDHHKRRIFFIQLVIAHFGPTTATYTSSWFWCRRIWPSAFLALLLTVMILKTSRTPVVKRHFF